MSTLFVNNLNTATGTTVTLASGKTLDTSGGTLIPSANQIIQVFEVEFANETSTTSSTFGDISGATISFAPKYSNSKLIFQGTFMVRYDHSSSSGIANRFIWNGTVVTPTVEYQGFAASGNNYSAFSLHGSITAGTTSTAIAKAQVARYSAGTGWINWNGNFTSGFTVMEIAQ
jgi:hypothetical protein